MAEIGFCQSNSNNNKVSKELGDAGITADLKAVQNAKDGLEAHSRHIPEAPVGLLDRDVCNVCVAESVGAKRHHTLRHNTPSPMYSSVPALAHFCKSPPFPHPKSKTLIPRGIRLPSAVTSPYRLAGELPAANLAIRTDLIQLLKERSAMMGDSARDLTSVLGRALSRSA